MNQTQSPRKPPIPVERTSRRYDPQGAPRSNILNEYPKSSTVSFNRHDESLPYISESSHQYLKDRVKVLSSEKEELHLQLVSLTEQMGGMQTTISRLILDNKRLVQENQMYQKTQSIQAAEVQHSIAVPPIPLRSNVTRPPLPKRLSTLQNRQSVGQSSSITSGHCTLSTEFSSDVRSFAGMGNNDNTASSTPQSTVNFMRDHILKQSKQIKEMKHVMNQLMSRPSAQLTLGHLQSPDPPQYSLSNADPNLTLLDLSMPSSSTQSRSTRSPPQSLHSYPDDSNRPLPLEGPNKYNEKPSPLEMLILDTPSKKSRSPIPEDNDNNAMTPREFSDEEISYSRIRTSFNLQPVPASKQVRESTTVTSGMQMIDLNDDSPELLESEYDILTRMDRQGPYGRDNMPQAQKVEIKKCPTCLKLCEITDRESQFRFQDHCLECVEKENVAPEPVNFPQGSPPTRDRTCPVCSALFPAAIRQNDYERHVIGHFEEDDIRQIGFEPILDPPAEEVDMTSSSS